MDIAVLGDEDTVLGFKLAGIKDARVFDGERAETDIKDYADAKILIVTEKVAARLREEDLLSKVRGAIAEIPDKEGSSGEALKSIARLLEEAIGVKLKD